MEKISIVQRRKDRGRVRETAAFLRARQREEMRDHAQQNKAESSAPRPPVIVKKKPVKEQHSLDLELSPEQSYQLSTLLQLNDIVKGSMEEANVKIYKENSNKVIFSFSVQPGDKFQMLTSDDVCNMLKISRKTLYKNVHENVIPGYKVGTQLRFFKEDIVAYLKKNRINS